MIKRILMPIDDSTCSDRAVVEGLRYAQQFGACVTFLHALEFTGTARSLALRDAAKETLAWAVCQAGYRNVPCTSVLVENARPVQAIHKAEQDVDLVILGSHGRNGLARILAGSTAEAALRRATVPYLVLREIESEAVPEDVPSEWRNAAP